MSKSWRLVELAGACFRGARISTVDVLDFAADIGVRQANPSLQVVRVDLDGAVSLAMQLLPELFAGPDRRLDERDLSALGGGARHHDRHAGELVSGLAALKAMMDRLVCADGGNPDPSSTHGKKASEAKALELKGWSYPRHLAGRYFGLVVHGDSVGAETLRRSLPTG